MQDMSAFHLVRFGLLGHVGRFAAVDAVRYPRRARVIVRSGRGLEVGEVLARRPTATCLHRRHRRGRFCAA